MSTATTNDTLESQLAPIAADLATCQDQIKTLQDQETFLKAAIRALVPGSDSYAAGNLTVTVSTNNRFDPKKALTLIPAPLAPLVIDNIPTVNKEKLKALAPDIFEASQTVGEFRVSIK